MLLEPIAVVGLGGILPDAPDIETFWRNLLAGHYAIRDLPQDAPYRWPLDSYYDPDPNAVDKTTSRLAAFAPDVAFKPIQFRIPPHTAAHMDRGQKMALLATRAALGDSGIDRSSLDTTRVRVIIGTSVPEMQDITRPRLVFDEVMHAVEASPVFSTLPELVRAQIVAQARAAIDSRYLPTTEDSLAGSIPNLVAGRVALCFDIRGGNVTLDAACASSLAALDHALKCLRLGEVDLVIAGGVDFAMSAASYVGFSKAKALSTTGSTPFDARADGFVMGEGAGILVLERLADAQRSSRKIYAVIRAVGTASDGNARNITAPSVDGQVRAIRAALDDSGIDTSTIGLVEAHGTSTVLGDVTEFQSLQRVFGDARQASPVYLGSVKANIGHLKAAAGIAGLIKAVLAVQSGKVPPMPKFVSAADGVDLERSPFVVNQKVATWTGRGATPRRACVDSFGFGGVNYSAIVEQYVPEFYASEGFEVELTRSSPYQRHYAGRSLPHLEEVSNVEDALRTIDQPLVVVDPGAGDLRLCTAPPPASNHLPAALRGWVPGIRPEDLGAPGFRRMLGIRFNYVVGEMAGGIASVDLVTAAARSGMLAFFGSGGLDLAATDAAIRQLQDRLGETPFGVNLLPPKPPGCRSAHATSAGASNSAPRTWSA
jgi:acyl transferase domain-containing protein